MINTLLEELREIARSILEQRDRLDLIKLEQQVGALQKKIIVLQHEQSKIAEEDSTAPVIEVEESIEVDEPPTFDASKNEAPDQPNTTFDNLFSDSISEPVFVKKEPSEPANINPLENTPKNLNDALGKGLKIGLNDRLAFIKNLFDESPQDYQRVISQISVYESFEEAQDFIENFVKPEYNSWEGKETYEERFYKIIEQNFN